MPALQAAGPSVVAMIPLTVSDYLLVLVAVSVGAAVQGSVGFGANLLAVPVLALIDSSALPATLTMWGLPLAVVRPGAGRDDPAPVATTPHELSLVSTDASSPHGSSIVRAGATRRTPASRSAA